MSFLDMDEWLIDLANMADIVYTPFQDVKKFPEGVDVTLVEGAVANEDHLEQMELVREPVLRRSYLELATLNPRIPDEKGIVPRLLDRVLPVHEVVEVDYYIPGCPPPAGRIRHVLEELIAGREPKLEGRELKFG
jgi:NAD-reducing hydrogenase small subunit